MKRPAEKGSPIKRIREAGNRINRFLRRNADGQEPAAREGNPDHNAKHTPKEKRERRVSWMFLSPSVIGVSVFFVLPFFVVIYYSLIDNPVQHHFVGFST